MGVLKKLAAATGLLAAAGMGETLYFYNRTMKRGNAKTDRTIKMAGTDWEKYFPLMEERKGFVMAQPHRDVYLSSFDGLKLHATFFPGMESTGSGEALRAGAESRSEAAGEARPGILGQAVKEEQPGTLGQAAGEAGSGILGQAVKEEQPGTSDQAVKEARPGTTGQAVEENRPEPVSHGTDQVHQSEAVTSPVRKAVICFHGYTGEGLSNHIAIADYFLKQGYAILLPDARAHGESEGEYIGFGCLDRKDARAWIQWLIGECGEDVAILLHGTSMGGATVLMTSGLELPSNVKGIVSDCGFTSPKEVFTHVLNHMYHLPAFPAIQGADLLNRKLAGYGMDECNARREVRRAKVPILFIHGSADTFVPCSMCDELYDNCASPKRKLIIEGASHAESYYKDMPVYEKALTEFAEDVMRDGGV